MVLDVKVLVSGLIRAGKPRDLFLKAREGSYTPVLSDQIVSEFVDVIGRRKFARYVDERDVRVFLRALHQTGRFTHIRSRFRVVEDDPRDDTILRSAHDSRADYVVWGDKHLLTLGEFRGIRIVTIEAMLRILDGGSGKV